MSAQGRGQSYQRLEFLGDRVLGVAAAEMLYAAYPQASEGELSMRLAKLVRRETCAAIAEEWDAGPHVVMGQGEVRAGGRKKAAILSDICESLIGAVFLDGGYEAARDLVQRSWRARMDADAEPERAHDEGVSCSDAVHDHPASEKVIGLVLTRPQNVNW